MTNTYCRKLESVRLPAYGINRTNIHTTDIILTRNESKELCIGINSIRSADIDAQTLVVFHRAVMRTIYIDSKLERLIGREEHLRSNEHGLIAGLLTRQLHHLIAYSIEGCLHSLEDIRTIG